MVDGDRGREPLTALFHSISLGELSVSAFFLLSVYLITKSMVRTERFVPFLERRVLRIYPGFIVASLLSIFVLGPLVGAEVWSDVPRTVAKLIMLREPTEYPGQLPGLHGYPLLNGSLWTISHEFRCYLLVAVLGVVGLLRKRAVVLALTLLVLAISVLATFDVLAVPLAHLHNSAVVRFLVGYPSDVIRLTAVFMVGACWFLFEPEMRASTNAGVAFMCLLVCGALLYRDPHFADVALAIFGGVTLYWVAFKADLGVFQNINDKWDISYGTYLYGWPIAVYIVWRNPGISPWTAAIITLPLALLAGAASWWGLERWTKDLVRSRSARVGREGVEASPTSAQAVAR